MIHSMKIYPTLFLEYNIPAINACLSTFLGEDVEDYLLEHGQLKKMTPLSVHLFFKKFNKTCIYSVSGTV